jgi:hypothetical protein
MVDEVEEDGESRSRELLLAVWKENVGKSGYRIEPPLYLSHSQ